LFLENFPETALSLAHYQDRTSKDLALQQWISAAI
jgi:hypothetical protein